MIVCLMSCASLHWFMAHSLVVHESIIAFGHARTGFMSHSLVVHESILALYSRSMLLRIHLGSWYIHWSLVHTHAYTCPDYISIRMRDQERGRWVTCLVKISIS